MAGEREKSSTLQELDDLVKEYGFTIPDRGLDDPCKYTNAAWRESKPDYCHADLLYFRGKSKNHAAGSWRTW